MKPMIKKIQMANKTVIDKIVAQHNEASNSFNDGKTGESTHLRQIKKATKK